MAYEDLFGIEDQADQDRKQREAELNAATLAGAKLGAQWGAQAAVMQVGATLEPYVPLVNKISRQEVVEKVSRELPGFKDFYGSQEAKKLLDERPALGKAILIAESRPDLQGDLEQLYTLAYEAARARQVIEQQAGTPQWSQSPGETRPGQSGQASPDLSTSEKRKAYIQDLEARGIKDANLDRADTTFGKLRR